MKNFRVIILLLIFGLASCNQRTKNDAKSISEAEANQDTARVKPISEDSIIIDGNNETLNGSKSWIDDFRNFRASIYNEDLSILKDYFNFPFDDPGKSIFHLADLSEKEWLIRKQNMPNSDLFYEEDLAKYHEKIFDARFKKCLLKIKSEELFENHLYRTALFEEKEIVYQMVVEFFPKDRTLTLNMAFGNNFRDEEGALISEGEHNVIYTFSIIDQKKLILKRIDVAG